MENLQDLIKLSMNYLQHQNGETNTFSYLVVPLVDVFDKGNNKVFSKGKQSQVSIDKFKQSLSFQIYRDVGHWVKGNSHKSYKSLNLLMNDFEIIQAEYLEIKEVREN